MHGTSKFCVILLRFVLGFFVETLSSETFLQLVSYKKCFYNFFFKKNSSAGNFLLTLRYSSEQLFCRTYLDDCTVYSTISISFISLNATKRILVWEIVLCITRKYDYIGSHLSTDPKKKTLKICKKCPCL